MTSPPVQIIGFASTDKVPGFVGEVVYGAGAVSAGDIPLVCLCVGQKIAGVGTAVVNQSVVPIRKVSDADDAFGAGSEIARMCYQALLSPGIQLYAAAEADPSGAAAASVTVTFTGTATASATYKYRIDGVPGEYGIATGDTPAIAAAGLAAAINANPRSPVQAKPPGSASDYAGGATLLVRKTLGARGNQGAYVQNTTELAGIAAAVTGGTTLTGVGYRFAGGTGTPDPTAILTTLYPGQYDRIALAANDTTTYTAAGRWRDNIFEKNGPLEGRPSFVIGGSNGTSMPTALTNAINDPMFQMEWLCNGESHPSEMAANFAGIRTITEQQDPDAAYDDTVLRTIAPQQNPADVPNRATLIACLNNGITPLSTTQDGKVIVIRSITTRSFSGAMPDYRTLDTSDAVVPQFIRKDLALFFATVFKVANKRVADDPPPGTSRTPPGVGTPGIWSSCVEKKLRDYERGVNGSPPIIINVDTNKPQSGYDPVAKRIMSLVPCVPAPNMHQIGVSIRQMNS